MCHFTERLPVLTLVVLCLCLCSADVFTGISALSNILYVFLLLKGFPIVPAVTYAVARGLFYNDK